MNIKIFGKEGRNAPKASFKRNTRGKFKQARKRGLGCMKLQNSRDQGPVDRGGGFKLGGFPIWTCPSFFVLLETVPILPEFSRFVRGLSGDYPDWSLPSFSDLSRKKSGKPPSLEAPGFTFSQTERERLQKIADGHGCLSLKFVVPLSGAQIPESVKCRFCKCRFSVELKPLEKRHSSQKRLNA